MSKKVLNPKEMMAAETSAVSVTFKKLEEQVEKPFEDDESEGDSEDESSEEGSDEDSTSHAKRARGSSAARVSEEKKVTGKEGWLYRENDSELRLTELYSKIWVSIFSNRLLFSKDSGTTSGAFSFFEATQKVKSTCFGYLDLQPTTEVKRQLINNKPLTKKPVGSYDTKAVVKKFTFQVKDGDAVVLFATDTEGERDEWVEVIKQAIKGTTHFLPIANLELPAGAVGENIDNSATGTNNTIAAGVSMKSGRMDRRSSTAAVDYPNKCGYLKKTSQGKGTFAISVVKKRWFRLASGELRYYEDEDESAIKLKECIHLGGAQILPVPTGPTLPALVHIQFTGNRSMKLEAPTQKIANEWRDAFAETIMLLAQTAPTQGTQKPIRRLNVHDFAPTTPAASANTNNASFLSTNSTNTSPVAPANGRRARAATTISSPGSAAAALKGSKSQDSDSDEDAPVSTQSFWGRMSISSKSSPVPSPKPRSMSSVNLHTSAAGASTHTEVHIPKFAQKHLSPTHKSIETSELLKECLQQNFLVKRLPDLIPLVELMCEHVAVPGEVVIWQGSSGDTFYALESGHCDVIKDGRVVSRIAAGKSFGELALVNNATRQATIRAASVCKLWCFTRHQYREVAVAQEIKQTEERIAFLKQIALFAKLMPSSLEKIADVMVLKSYATGDRIIRQGDVGDAFYMIQSGRAVVTQTTTFGTSAGTELARLGPGKSFGELALIEDAPRKATVTASCACKCWTLDRQNFKSLFGSMDAAVNESIGVQMLQKVKILEALTEKQLQTVARCLVSKKYLEGEVIIKQGDVGDCFYLIADGEVSVQVNHITVATLGGGSFFGEMSLLSNERRSATVCAVKETTLLVLSRADFQEHLGTLEEVNEEARRRKEAATRPKGGEGGGRFLSSLRRVSDSMFSTSPTSSPAAPLTRAKSLGASPKGLNTLFSSTNAMFELGSLERVKKLASGTFGTVYLVQHIMTSKFYAMKVLHKQDLCEKCQEPYVYSERDIMLTLVDSQYVAALYATLQDSKSIYYIMQYVPGGDLWELLYTSNRLKRTKEGGIPLPQALFYAANVLVAINHIHDQEIVFRNIKPENLVVDGTGYLKIVDFGSAKRLPIGKKTNTLCGAAEYIAPEMILSKGYNKAIDFWAIGVLLFELLTRTSPFAHTNLSMVYQNIMDSEGVLKLIFSGGQTLSGTATSSSAVAATASALDTHAKDAISNFLLFNPNMRLGMRHDGMADIWNHPCFLQWNQEKIEKKSLTAPYVPDVDEQQMGVASDEDVMGLVEDEDDIPAYRGTFDYADF